jgi:iron complex transport system permease protein
VKRSRRRVLILAGSLTAGLAVILFAFKSGGVPMGWKDLWLILTGGASPSDPALADIFWKVRAPRVVMAGLVGGLLAAAGTALQGLLRNPLADPYLLGVSSGASLGAVAGILLGAATPVPFAVGGAVLALGMLLLLSRIEGVPNMTLMILAGVAVNAFASSCLAFLLTQARPYETGGILFWLLGSLGPLSWGTLGLMCVLAVILGGILVLTGAPLNLLAQGDETARSLGLPVGPAKWLILLLCAAMTGLAVTFNGMIPFVGLVVPHGVRLLFGSDHRRLIPLSAVGGALLLMGADALGRSLMAPQEIPVGVVTALIGAPVFVMILRKERKKLL